MKLRFRRARQEKTAGHRRYLNRRRLIVGLIVLLLLFIWSAVHWLNAPSRGHIIPTDQAKLTKTAPVIKAPPAATLENNYFVLALPLGYAVQSDNQTPPNLLYSQTVIKTGDFGSLIISIAIQNLPAGGLSADSSYQLRTGQPARYQLTSQVVHADMVQIASDTQSASVVAFWPHRNYLATISVSSSLDTPSSDQNSEQLAALQPLLNAWQWR